MINVVSKSSNLSPYLKATSQAVASNVKPLVTPTVITPKATFPSQPVALTNYALTKLLPSNDIRVKAGPTGNFIKYLSTFNILLCSSALKLQQGCVHSALSY